MSKPKPNPLQLEQALLGELPDGEALPEGSESQVEALRQENQQILDRYPASRVAKEIHRRLEEQRTPQRRWAMILLPAAAVPLVLAAVMWGARGPLSRPGSVGDESTALGPDTDVQLKGSGPELRVYRRRAGAAPERLHDGSAVREGEVIQVAYVAAGRSAGVIVSIDGSGNATLHHPTAAAGATALQRGGEQPLASGYKLDSAPRFERFFFVTAKTGDAIDVGQVLAAVRTLAAQPEPVRASLTLPASLDVSSLTLRKEVP